MPALESYRRELDYSYAPGVFPSMEAMKKRFENLNYRLYAIENEFFGKSVTVTGLVTGSDILAQLKGKDLGQRLLIPANMLRSGERVFLDDVSLDDVERELGVPAIPVAQDGYELLDAMVGIHSGEASFCGTPLPEDEYYRYNPGVR